MEERPAGRPHPKQIEGVEAEEYEGVDEVDVELVAGVSVAGICTGAVKILRHPKINERTVTFFV